MVVKLYVDMRSPPCRSVLKFLKASTIKYEVVEVDVLKGEQRNPDYSGKFPLMKVPALQDDDLCMSESVAIFRYLSGKFLGQFPDHWYPADLKKRAKVDEYLAFHHEGIRNPLATLVITTAILPPMTGQAASEDDVSKQSKACNEALDTFERVFLGDNNYILGGEISIADVFFSSEIVDLTISGIDFLKDRPKVKAYMDRIRARLNPAFDEIDQEFCKWKASVLSG